MWWEMVLTCKKKLVLQLGLNTLFSPHQISGEAKRSNQRAHKNLKNSMSKLVYKCRKRLQSLMFRRQKVEKNDWISAHKDNHSYRTQSRRNIFQPRNFTFISLATEGSHLSPLILFSSAILSSSLLAAAFAAAAFASSLANDFWHASLAAAVMSSPSTATDWICLLNC